MIFLRIPKSAKHAKSARHCLALTKIQRWYRMFRKKQSILFISTTHNNGKIDTEIGKPESILYHSHTKVEVVRGEPKNDH